MKVNEIERTAEITDGFYKVGHENWASGLLGILLFPFALVFLFFSLPVSLILLNKANKKLRRFINDFKKEELVASNDSFAKLKDLEHGIKRLKDKHSESFREISEVDSWFWSGFAKQIRNLSDHIDSVIELVDQKLYVDASKVELSEESYQDLSDFFGPDEDYQEDTFIQLNPQ